MESERFRASLAEDSPPAGLDPLLQALWHEARGDWARAHEIAQRQQGAAAARVHAYLHRKEGDLANADYWYARAGSERPAIALPAEWERLVEALLAADGAPKPSP